MFEKRQAARLDLPDPLTGDILAKYEVRVVNLSVEGAGIEHEVMLRPGQPCFLRVTLTDRAVFICASVMWSCASRFGGEGNSVIYQTGLKFERVPETTRNELAVFLATKKSDSRER